MKRVLIINPFGIGDAIFSMTVVRALRSAKPELFIGFLCNERTESLVRTNTDIDRTFVFNRDLFRAARKKSFFLFWKNLKGLLDVLRAEKFDTALDFSMGREYGFFCRLIGVRLRAGLDYKNRGLFLNKKIKIAGYVDEHAIETQLQVLSRLGVAYEKPGAKLPFFIAEATALQAKEHLKKAFGASSKIIGVAPGGGKSWGHNAVYKQWAPERFAQAINEACYDAKVLVFGSPDEKELLEDTASRIRSASVLICQESLPVTAAYLKKCDFLLCNDGGLLHMANSLGVKTVSLFGPVDEKVYGPYGQDVPHSTVTESVPCRPCYKNFHFPPCSHNRRCLDELPVKKVADAVKKIA